MNNSFYKGDYSVRFTIIKSDSLKEIFSLKSYLESISYYISYNDNGDTIMVNIYTDNPGKAIEESLRYGSLVDIEIENVK